MPDLKGQAAEHVLSAQRSWELFNAGLSAFRAELVREDWDRLEVERLACVSALESYLDHMVAGTRIVSEVKRHG